MNMLETREQSTSVAGAESKHGLPLWLGGILPLVLLALFVALFLATGPLGFLKTFLPPIEQLAFQRVSLKPDEITVKVVNDGPDPVTIAQVLVNNAYWMFTIEPGPTVPRLGEATITIPYPWVEGDVEKITLLSRNGLTFETEVPVATSTPVPSFRNLSSFAMLGVYVGVIPVFVGLLWLPFLRQLRASWYAFFLSLTVGLLVFLGVDAFVGGIEVAGQSPKVFQSSGVFTFGFALAVLALAAINAGAKKSALQKGESYQKLVLAYLVALGIGVHNFGEGLAIGGAYAVGEVALGALLVLGFMIHNVTEGAAIVAPVAKSSVRIKQLLLMGLLAGVPTIAGTWLGGFSYSAIWSVLFLAVGAGAVFQVVVEILRQMAKGSWDSLVTPANVFGFLSGLAVMYVTGLFVTA